MAGGRGRLGSPTKYGVLSPPRSPGRAVSRRKKKENKKRQTFPSSPTLYKGTFMHFGHRYKPVHTRGRNKSCAQSPTLIFTCQFQTQGTCRVMQLPVLTEDLLHRTRGLPLPPLAMLPNRGSRLFGILACEIPSLTFLVLLCTSRSAGENNPINCDWASTCFRGGALVLVIILHLVSFRLCLL